MDKTEKLLKVQWLDARVNVSSDWNHEIEDIEGYLLENIGFGFVKKNGDIVLFSQKDTKAPKGEYCYFWLIPKAYITKIGELEVKEETK